jgi:EpsD family peptidyl-prolyl cis-trans isomerase
MKPLATLLLACAAVFLVASCGDKGAKGAKTQVVAKVNASEISLHQVNHVLQREAGGNVPPDRLEAARQEILDRLIDQELLAAKAVEDKLDRTPDTLMALEMARKEILARAYAEQVAANLPKVDYADAVRYYASHRDAYEDRRVFVVEEMRVQATPEIAQEVRALVQRKTPLPKIRDALKEKNVDAQLQGSVATSDRMRPDMVERLRDAQTSDLLVFEDGRGMTVLRLVAMRKEPIPEATALPSIARILANEAVGKRVKSELAELKANAKVEYLGEFAGTRPAAAPGTAASGVRGAGD